MKTKFFDPINLWSQLFVVHGAVLCVIMLVALLTVLSYGVFTVVFG